jgi:hypothetical protein
LHAVWVPEIRFESQNSQRELRPAPANSRVSGVIEF